MALGLAGSLAAAAPLAPGPDEDARIAHALNRLGYGPRPGNVERVRAKPGPEPSGRAVQELVATKA